MESGSALLCNLPAHNLQKIQLGLLGRTDPTEMKGKYWLEDDVP